MTFLDDLAPILDPKYGLPLGQGGGRDNILKDAAVALVIASALPGSDLSQVTLSARTREFIAASTVPGYPGLLYREPGNAGTNSVDNLIGAVVAGSLTGGGYEREVLLHAKGYRYTFAVTTPEAAFSPFLPWTWKYSEDWYGRFLGLPAFLALAAGASAGPLALAAFYETSKITGRTERGNTSDKILLWLEFELLQPDLGLAGRSYRSFLAAMEAMYAGGPAELLSIYYGASHPFATHARGSW